MEITVVRPGMLTTVQDLGRLGHRAAGVPLSGAVDPVALRLANLLVGNAEGAPALEITLAGPELVFPSETTIAIGGASFAELPSWQPIRIRAGERIALGAARTGCRACLAIAGGIDVPEVLGSRSTYLRGRFGGLEGRALRAGDVFRVEDSTLIEAGGHWHIDPRILPSYGAPAEVRVVRGAQAEEFDPEWTRAEFRVTPQSDRMGLRLAGLKLHRREGAELLSAAVAPGAIQVPPDGEPIVLLADAQTIGGYPKIAHVIGVDLPLMAQLRPGEAVRFREVSLTEAHRLWRAREHALAMLREGLADKLRLPVR